MLYTFGRLFFPRLIHQEKKLRERMHLVAVVSGLILVVGVSVLLLYLNHTRPRSPIILKPSKTQSPQPAS
jgi:hypothetical protein